MTSDAERRWVELHDRLAEAALTYAAMKLWHRLPPSLQGDRGLGAAALRADRAHDAARRWLALQTEMLLLLKTEGGEQ